MPAPKIHTDKATASFIQSNIHLLKHAIQLLINDGYVESANKEAMLVDLHKQLLQEWPAYMKGQGHVLPASEKSLLASLSMELSDHLADIKMMQTQSSRLVVKYKFLVEKRVRHFVFSGSIKKHDAEEYVQAICEQLLLKVQKGQFVNFVSKAKVSTFMRTVIDNLINSELKAKHRRQTADAGLDTLYYVADTSMNVSGLQYDPVFQQHVHLLRSSFVGFPTVERNKLQLSLKVVYRILLQAGDIRSPYTNCTDDLLVEILSIFGMPYATMAKGELFEKLTWAVNKLHVKQKPMTVAGLRKWYDRRFRVLWTVVFNRSLTASEKKVLDAYFELVVYKLYNRIE